MNAGKDRDAISQAYITPPKGVATRAVRYILIGLLAVVISAGFFSREPLIAMLLIVYSVHFIPALIIYFCTSSRASIKLMTWIAGLLFAFWAMILDVRFDLATCLQVLLIGFAYVFSMLLLKKISIELYIQGKIQGDAANLIPLLGFVGPIICFAIAFTKH
ncbi:MAG: hypothetical protein PSY14_02770 [bacterium]|nr:hypothetical protein [bacterium]